MKLLELKVCPKCGYIRKDQERAPAYECPHCGIIYGKYRPPAPPPAPASAGSTPQAQPAIQPGKVSVNKAAPAAAPVPPATSVDAFLLAVALGVLLEPVFGLTRLLKRIGFPGDGALSAVFGGRFFMIEVGVAGTLLSIALAAVILFALGAQRSVPLSRGRKVAITLLAINYLVTMRTLDSPLSKLSSLVTGNHIWVGAQDLTLSLTMVVFGVLVTQHLIQWSRALQVYNVPEVSA
jgi:hypothetical protein